MRWPNEERNPDTVEALSTLFPWVDETPRLPPRLHTRVQARIAALVPAVPFARVLPPAAAELAARLAAFLDIESAQAQQFLHTLAVAPGPPWRPSGLPGLHVIPLLGGPRVGGAICILVYLAPGHGLPPHRHQGEEWTVVLHGWVQEDDGHCWGPGDRLHRAPGSVHALSALAAMPCLCAVVSNGGMEFVAACPVAPSPVS